MSQSINEANKSSSKISITNMKPIISTEELVRLPVDELLVHLDSSQSGLSSQQAAERLEAFGRNVLAQEHKHSAIREFFNRFKSPLVIILLIAGIISGFLG